MALTAGTHVGPWTEDDLVGLPEDAQRYELLEGTLLVSLPRAGLHQLASLNLAAGVVPRLANAVGLSRSSRAMG